MSGSAGRHLAHPSPVRADNGLVTVRRMDAPEASTVRLEEGAPEPDAGSSREAPLWRLQSDAVNERLLARWLPASMRSVLKTDLYDEAVSSGLYPLLAGRAERVAGIDVSPEIAALAARRHPRIEVKVADVRALPFESGSFDAVASISTLDHFGDGSQVAAAVRELGRILRAGGHLVITLDNPINPLLAVRNRLPGAIARRLRRGFPYEPGWTCGPRRLRAVLGEAGFEVQAQTAVLHAPRALTALRDRRSPVWDRRLLRLLGAIERLERFPTRYLSGHFVAAHAVLK